MSIRQSASAPTATRKLDSVRLRHRSAGFNLIELMVAVAVGAILIGIGASSYKYVTNSNRVSTEVNGLLGDLMVARSEAIRQSYNVIVCPLPSGGGTSCATSSTSWQYGWLVFADVNNNGAYDSGTDVLIRVQQPFSSTDTLVSDTSVYSFKFNVEGFAVGLPTTSTQTYVTVTLHTNPTNDQWTRCLQVVMTGALTTERKGTGGCS